MSTRTRRLVFLAALVVALAIPAESILLKALIMPSEQEAIQSWVGGLDSATLTAATASIQSYPLVYRRELMRRQSPAVRASVWRGHLEAYLGRHPELDASVVVMINAAADLLTPSIFTEPTDADRVSVETVADQLIASIGREETEYLLYRLGPRDGTFASFEPLALYLGNKVRGMIQLNADSPACDCSSMWGCPDWLTTCTQAISCDWDTEWPACGWLWNTYCDGLCLSSW